MKRDINIEIASELVDLIMDVANEAYEFQEDQSRSGGQALSKPLWREWMDVFTQGKKVSEINLVINEDEGRRFKDNS